MYSDRHRVAIESSQTASSITDILMCNDGVFEIDGKGPDQFSISGNILRESFACCHVASGHVVLQAVIPGKCHYTCIGRPFKIVMRFQICPRDILTATCEVTACDRESDQDMSERMRTYQSSLDS